MAVAKTGGGAGAAGGTTIAATRIEVIDAHVVQMMRDVMDSSDIPLRLNVAAAAGGGGGGGGLDNVGSTATVGTAATQPGTISRCVVTTAAGDGGAGGAGTTGGLAFGGHGGGGAGGYRTASGFTVVASQSYPITVGDGGTVSPYAGGSENGGDSVFSTITAPGGGGGGGAGG